MLTFDETVSAIKKLDTEKEIIARACLAVLHRDDVKTSSKEERLALDIMDAFIHIAQQKEILIAATLLAGKLAAALVKADEIVQCHQDIQELLLDTFKDTLKRRVYRLMRSNPVEGILMLEKMMEGIKEAQPAEGVSE